MSKELTPSTTLDHLKKQAKRWLKALRDSNREARRQFEQAYPKAPTTPVLRDVQHALARLYGREDWKALIQAVRAIAAAASEGAPPSGAARLKPAADYQQAAQDWIAAYEGDTEALDRLNVHYSRAFTPDDHKAELWRRNYAFRQRSSREPQNFIKPEEAQLLVAQDAGFGNWDALIEAAAAGKPPAIPAFSIDPKGDRISPARHMQAADWDDFLGILRDLQIPHVDGSGLLTDAALKQIARMDHVTSLNLAGSRELTDDSLMYLASMPQLEELELSEHPGGRLTDRGLEVLRHLPNLRRFEMCWQRGFTDAGVANLRLCRKLEKVNLMGSPTGDGAIEALQGMEALRDFSAGRRTTDASLPLLHNFPGLKHYQAQPLPPGIQERPAGAARLLLDGPFTDAGLAGLGGLDGVFELDLFWHVTAISAGGFAHLAGLPNLAMLGCDGKLSGNEALRHIAAIPNLRRLRIQESVATDEGFEALRRSQTLEYIWGRECPHFGNRGFLALSRMPALRGFGIGCKKVDDAALATLPDFPALRELTPIGFTDDGFRHIGRCRQIERLSCMYCRETGDAATAHIANLPLKYYYAGLTQITDRSLELLGSIHSLEQVEFYECKGPTDAGLPHLAALPNLQEAHFDSLPGVTLAGTKVFPARVRVYYST